MIHMPNKPDNSIASPNPSEGPTAEPDWNLPEGATIEYSMTPANQSTPAERYLYWQMMETERRIAAGEKLPLPRLECCGTGLGGEWLRSLTDSQVDSMIAAESALRDEKSGGRTT